MDLSRKDKKIPWIISNVIALFLTGCSLLSMYHEESGVDLRLLPKQVSNKKYGYVDKSGYFIIPPKFDMAYYFSNSTGMAVVVYNGRLVYINHQGAIIADVKSK